MFPEPIIIIFTMMPYVHICMQVRFYFRNSRFQLITHYLLLLLFLIIRFIYVCENEHVSAQSVLSHELPFGDCVIGHYHMSCTHFRTNWKKGLVFKLYVNHFVNRVFSFFFKFIFQYYIIIASRLSYADTIMVFHLNIN